MKRVVILGRGAAGKSTLARRLGEIIELPVIELDKVFWQPDLIAMSPGQWSVLQQKLVAQDSWILDGDLGPYDVIEPRLRAADTIILLDFSFVRCAWRAFRRAHERADFWQWVRTYRRRYLPTLKQAIANYASNAQFLILRNPRAVRRFLVDIARPAV